MSLRIAASVARAALDPTRPLITHLVITRRCNLSCGYCFEYDQVSPPVPAETLRERIDHLARLRSVFVTLTGGESCCTRRPPSWSPTSASAAWCRSSTPTATC
jgi:sulfatase maturation enzyme AslB (radical SAM superfamily)